VSIRERAHAGRPRIEFVSGYGLEIRALSNQAAPQPEDELFEWRIIAEGTQQVVLLGTARTREAAIQEGLTQAWANLRLAPNAAGSLPPEAAEVDRPPQPLERPIDFVRALLPRAEGLPSVSGASAGLLAQALVEAGADAGAVFISDDDAWLVTAGSGLRPLENRCALTSEHWLVSSVRAAADGVLVNDADSPPVRARLSGAPMAWSRHLMAVKLTDPDGLLLLARHTDSPFDKSDLRRIYRVGRTAAAALAEAVELRTLARALARYADLAD
jgi:hypothetical protein